MCKITPSEQKKFMEKGKEVEAGEVGITVALHGLQSNLNFTVYYMHGTDYYKKV